MDKGGLELREQSAEFSDLGADGPFAAIQLDNHQSARAFQEFGSGPTSGRIDREAIGQFQSAREESGSEERSNRSGSRLHVGESHPDTGPIRRERQ